MKTGKRPRDDKKRGKEEDEVEEKLIAKKVSKVSVASIASAASAAGATLSKKALSTLKKTGRLPTSVPGRAAKAAEALQPCKTDPKKTEALMVSARKMFERTHFTLSDMLNPVHSAFKSDLKDRWMTMPKEERSVIIEADKRALSLRAQAAKAHEEVEFPFPTIADDHCETGLDALSDAAELLKALAKSMGVEPSNLKLYDPFYCNGASAEHLKTLGFPNVYNVREDWYAAVRENRVPSFDVLITNPAYSGDHISLLLSYCSQLGKPFLLLMPNYVSGKPECRIASSRIHSGEGGSGIVFVYPPKRYMYWTPHGLRDKSKVQSHSSALGSRTSPFVSFWYCSFGTEHEENVLTRTTGPTKRLRSAFILEDLPPSVKPPSVAFSDEGEEGGFAQFDQATFGLNAALHAHAVPPRPAQQARISSSGHWVAED